MYLDEYSSLQKKNKNNKKILSETYTTKIKLNADVLLVLTVFMSEIIRALSQAKNVSVRLDLNAIQY